jgi:acetate---CoA ligase (ADP-forming)
MDHTAPARAPLATLFSPRSVAIVGASQRETSLAARPLRLLDRFGFQGEVYPVNPSYDEIGGRPCYPSLAEVPGAVDLAALIVPAGRTLEVVRQCVEANVGSAVLFSSGFAELGDEGRTLQEELVAVAREGGLRLLGPNCQGVVNREANLVVSISAALQAGLPPDGPVAYIGQSGAIGGSVLHVASTRGMGLGAWVSTGNEADIDLVEAASHVIEQPNIEVVACYLESISDGGSYETLAARTAELGKDLVVLRSGTSRAGRRAVASHTGALLTPDAAFESVSERHGVVLVDDTDTLVEAAFTLGTVPRMAGPGVGIITSSGGAGILAADHAERCGLEVHPLDAATSDAVAARIPEYGAATNPVDLTAQLFAGPEEADRLRELCVLVGRSPGIDALVVTLTMVVEDVATGAVEAVMAAAEELDVPVVLAWLAGDELTEEARARCRERSFPIFRSARDACRALAHVRRRSTHGGYRRAADPDLDRDRLRAVVAGRPTTEAAAQPLLDVVGVPRPAGVLVRDGASARAAVADLTGPFVIKIQSADLPHKSDVGGVRLGVAAEELPGAIDEMVRTVAGRCPDAELDGVLVQELVDPGGVEMLVGLTSGTGGFPPLLTLGFGGVTAELHRDVVSAPAPVGPDEVDRLVGQLRGAPLLNGFRGAPPSDLDALREVVHRLSVAYLDLADEVDELEINPLLVRPAGHGVVAAAVLLHFTSDH